MVGDAAAAERESSGVRSVEGACSGGQAHVEDEMVDRVYSTGRLSPRPTASTLERLLLLTADGHALTDHFCITGVLRYVS